MRTSGNMACRVCGSASEKIFSAEILRKYQVDYCLCSQCGYLQMEDLSHLPEAYRNSINQSDVGLLARNYRFVEQLAPFFYFSGKTNGRFLDFGGGYGIFSRLMRDIGFPFYWDDPYTENLFVPGFESAIEGDFTAITALELFEHLENPVEILSQLLSHTDTVAIGTNLQECRGNARLEDWQYLGREHGQHIGFFSLKTMKYLANKFNLFCYGDGKYLTVLARRELSSFSLRMLGLRHRFSIILLEFVKHKMRPLIESDHAMMITKEPLRPCTEKACLPK